MDNFNRIEANDNSSENSETSENDNRNTIINELNDYSENIFQNLIVCSSITLIYVLTFSLLFVLFICLLYLF